MSSTLMEPPRVSHPRKGEPVWEIAQLYPPQGDWTEEEYLALDTNHLIEFTDGYIEVLPMPTMSHQEIVAYLYGALLSFVSAQNLGKVLFAPLRIKIRNRAYREPDILFMLKENRSRMANAYWQSADLVMEVVSEGAENRQRDLRQKRDDYEAAGVGEYWIVDPLEKRITVLSLREGKYVEHGVFVPGQTASSAMLKGFEVGATAVFERE